MHEWGLFGHILSVRGPRGILARTLRIQGVIKSIPRGIEE
jgi:hypothetical protein